jgi:hypothetical protein
MTALKANSDGIFNWLGGGEASFLNFAADSPKAAAEAKCAGITDDGLQALRCDDKQDFGCEAKAEAIPTELENKKISNITFTEYCHFCRTGIHWQSFYHSPNVKRTVW